MTHMAWTNILALLVICLHSDVVEHASTAAANVEMSSGGIKTTVVPLSHDLMSQLTRKSSATHRPLPATDTTTLGPHQTDGKVLLTHSDFTTTTKSSLNTIAITPGVERTAPTTASEDFSARLSMRERTTRSTDSFINTRPSSILTAGVEEATTKSTPAALEVDASTTASLIEGAPISATSLVNTGNTDSQTASTPTSRPEYANETVRDFLSASRSTDPFLQEDTSYTITSTGTLATTRSPLETIITPKTTVENKASNANITENVSSDQTVSAAPLVEDFGDPTTPGDNITSNEHTQEDNTILKKPFDDTKTTASTVDHSAELITNLTNSVTGRPRLLDGTTQSLLDSITETATIRGYTPNTDAAPESKLLNSSLTTTVNTTMDTLTPLADTLNELIMEHIILCGLRSLCTVESPYTKTNSIACCSECSCDTGCLTHRNCCVDYALILARNNTTFSTLDELHGAMANITRLALETVLDGMYIKHPSASLINNNGHDEGEIFNTKGVAGNDITTIPTSGRISHLTATNFLSRKDSTHTSNYIIECLPREMFRSQRKSKSREYYYIVTGCKKPGVYSDNECYKNNSTQTGFFDDIPVTSFMSGKTYRNRSVLECCDDDNGPFEYWEISVECDDTMNFAFIPIYVLHPLKLLDGENIYNHCSTVFGPNAATQARGLAPKKCRNVDIHTCEDAGSSQRGLLLKSFCERERQYVQLESPVMRTVYKNVACMVCNNVSYETHTTCKDVVVSSNTMRLRVNLDDLSRHQTPLEELSDGGLLNVEDLPTLDKFTYGCSSGFVFVPKLGVCKRLFCPRSMFIVNGSCVPLFGHVDGASFKTVFNMKVLSTTVKSVNKTQFEDDFVSFLDSGLLANASLTTNHIHIRSLGMTYMVEMLLTPNKDTEVTINDVARAVTSLYYTTADIWVSHQAVVRVGISPGTSFYFHQSRHVRTGRVDTNGAKDVKTPRDDGLVLNRIITISESYTCYRIGIDVHDFKVLSKLAVRIPAINETIYTENMDFRPSSSELLTCIDLFIDGYRHIHTDDVSHNNLDVKKRFDISRFNDTRAPVANNKEIDYSVLIVIIGVAGIISVFVARLAVKHFWARILHWRNNIEVN